MLRFLLFGILLLTLCTQKKRTDTPNIIHDTIRFEIDSLNHTYSATLIRGYLQKTMIFHSFDSGHHYSNLDFYIDSVKNQHALLPWFKLNLHDQIQDIQTLWDTMETKISINLEWAAVDYPQLYKDVFTNYIKVFENSKNWENYLRTYKPKRHIERGFDNVLDEGMFYQPFDNLLKIHGYSITGYFCEHCILNSKKELKEAGFISNTPIPTCIAFGLQVKRMKN